MPVAPVTTGYSATVALALEWPGGHLRLSQVAPDWIIASEPVDLPPFDAEVVVVIDGKERRTLVRLGQGMTRDDEFTPVQRRGA